MKTKKLNHVTAQMLFFFGHPKIHLETKKKIFFSDFKKTIRVYKNTTEIPTIHKKCIKEIEQRKKHVKLYHQNYYLENKQKIID